jgi:hypothetical protein
MRRITYSGCDEFINQRLFRFCKARTVMMTVSRSEITRYQKNSFVGAVSLRKCRIPKASGINGLYASM